ncbi:unnamed protein product [Microthlaspi erraticum]|uniref:Uncharacterized protein n=1 Tax=Microthlaspi erraticum TaxID=1685480 RepID=A0A6D2I9B6_9BRAS|nr:unnamed protein product [Microthlaspi erraticum]
MGNYSLHMNLDRVEAWPVELRNSTGWSSRRSSWSSRWLLPSSFAYPVELLPCAKSLHAPCPICSRMLQKTYFKGPNMHIVCSSSYTRSGRQFPSRSSPPQIAVDIDDEEGEDLVEYADIPAPNSIELEQNPEPELDRAEETETQKTNQSSIEPRRERTKQAPANQLNLLQEERHSIRTTTIQTPSTLSRKLPFIDALMLIPPYQKFLKDAVQQRTREAQGMVVLTRECSAIIQRKVISDKKEDPGSFTLPCMLGPYLSKTASAT